MLLKSWATPPGEKAEALEFLGPDQGSLGSLTLEDLPFDLDVPEVV